MLSYLLHSLNATFLFLSVFSANKNPEPDISNKYSTYHAPSSAKDNYIGSISPEKLVSFAKSLIGVRYRYASSNPNLGFDCSGFINYVFSHYDIKVPRSSASFTSFGKEIELQHAKRGDLILFTGTNSNRKVVGHIGIITSNPNEKIAFIHSTSGKAYGVIITPLNKYYVGRFVKVIRVLD